MSARTHIGAAGAFLVAALLLPQVSSAYSFVPTDLEFASWPEYCRARYVTTNIGSTSRWSRDYSNAMIEQQRRLLGGETFLHIHHYCAGIAYLSRSRIEGNPERRTAILRNADTEASYTHQRIPASSPMFASVSNALGQIYKGLGRPHEAIEFVKGAIKAQPTNPQGYLGLAMLYRDLKKSDEARDTLLAGDQAVEGESAEIHYFLGLTYLDLNDPDQALEYARKAYEKDYPLPGLRDKLRIAGKWTE